MANKTRVLFLKGKVNSSRFLVCKHVQDLQPAEAEADPAEWAEGQLQGSNQAAESHGSAPSAGAHAGDADTADSAAAGAAEGSAGSPARSAAYRAGQRDGQQEMQTEPPEQQLESSMLSRSKKL